MKLTQEQFNEILRRKAIREANPVLAGVGRPERKQDPQPALDGNHAAQQSRSRSVAIGVTIISCRRRILDTDNSIAGGNKHLRDCIARTLGVDDADKRVRWFYGQIEATRNGTIVKIETL